MWYKELTQKVAVLYTNGRNVNLKSNMSLIKCFLNVHILIKVSEKIYNIILKCGIFRYSPFKRTWQEILLLILTNITIKHYPGGFQTAQQVKKKNNKLYRTGKRNPEFTDIIVYIENAKESKNYYNDKC